MHGLAEARERIEQLRSFYRRLKHLQESDGAWDWWLRNEIEAIEADISKTIKQMTAGQGDHLVDKPYIHLTSVYRPLPLYASLEV